MITSTAKESFKLICHCWNNWDEVSSSTSCLADNLCIKGLGTELFMAMSHIEYMEQCSGDSRIAIGLRHMSKLNIGDFYLKLFAQSELDQASTRIQEEAISWLKNDLERIQRDFQKAKTELFYSLEVSEAKWVLKQVKLELNRLKVNLNEVKARKLKDPQERVNFNRNRTNDASHE